MVEGLNEALARFLKIEGIHAVVLMSYDGFVIESVGSIDSDIESLGLLVTAEARTMAQRISLTELNSSEYEISLTQSNKVLMGTIGEEIIAVVAEKQASTERIKKLAGSPLTMLSDILCPGEYRKGRKIYRYSSSKKKDGFQEIGETPKNLEKPPEITFDITLLNELEQLTQQLYGQDLQTDKPIHSEKTQRFLELLDLLHDELHVVKTQIPREEGLEKAMVQFIVSLKQQLVISGATHYQVLALATDADVHQVRHHYGVLKDLYAYHDSIDPDFSAAVRLSQAFIVLRSTNNRHFYNTKLKVMAKGAELTERYSTKLRSKAKVWTSEHSIKSVFNKDNLETGMQHVKSGIDHTRQGLRELKRLYLDKTKK